MGIYTDEATIVGIRILIEEPVNSGDYYVNHEFTGPNWQKKSFNTISNFIGRNNVKIQTLHPSSTSYGEERESCNLWLDNKDIKLESLL
jgi:hypothetical protein